MQGYEARIQFQCKKCGQFCNPAAHVCKEAEK
jgi:hypothetical protein